MSVISEPLDRMEALRCFSKSLLLFWLSFWLTMNVKKGFSFQIGRHGRQLAPRTETVARTITVAVTENTFETKANLCVSLINATRPCVGRQVDWTRISSHLKEAVNPTIIQKVETTALPAMSRLNDRDLEIASAQQLVSSLKEPEEEKGREAQRQSPAFIRRITHGFSNALGLARTIVNTFTETKTMTTTYTEIFGYNHFYISDCIPPIMYYPVCKSSATDEALF